MIVFCFQYTNTQTFCFSATLPSHPLALLKRPPPGRRCENAEHLRSKISQRGCEAKSRERGCEAKSRERGCEAKSRKRDCEAKSRKMHLRSNYFTNFKTKVFLNSESLTLRDSPSFRISIGSSSSGSDTS